MIEEEGVTADEGYQSAMDCTTCKKCLLKIEESYKQQIAALELELQHQRNVIDKYYRIKNELTNDIENFLEGKGKRGKGYVKKGCNLKQLTIKEQYLSKIKSEEGRFKFLQLDHQAQHTICKIDTLREFVSDNNFINTLMEMFEEKSIELQTLKETVEEAKALESEYAKTIDELMHHHHETMNEKDHEIDYLRNNVQVVFVEKEAMGESSKSKNQKKSRKHLKTDEPDDDYQVMMGSLEGLRELDYVAYDKVKKMLGWQK